MFSAVARRGYTRKVSQEERQNACSRILFVFWCQVPFFFLTPSFEPRHYKHRKDFPIYIWSTKGHSLEEFLALGTAELLAGK